MDAEREPELSLTLYYKGRELFEAGNASEAVRYLAESWALSPHANTAYQLALAFKLLGNTEDAHRWFAEAYQLNARNGMIATAHAAALSEQGSNGDACDVLETLLTHMPTYGPARKLLTSLRP